MSERTQFTIETIESGLNYGRYRVEPLEPGYGTTIGNALRRILLRSLEGVAISRVRIDNVWHEFSTIKDVREDVTEVVLNLKRIRLKRVVEINDEIRGHLFVKADGVPERVVTAQDIQLPAEVDLINPDQPIATLDAPDAVLDMDVWIARGRGYRPAEAQKTFALGEIPIDAIFTPIQNVNYVVERTRVGQNVDYDRLILEILTDGTIEPDDALSQAAEILVEHAKIFSDFNRKDTALPTGSPFISEEAQNRPLAELGLSPRVSNALRSRGIDKVGQVLTLDPDQLLSIRNFGPRSLKELREKLAEYGYLPELDPNQIIAEEGESADDPNYDSDEMAEAIASLRGRLNTSPVSNEE